MTFTEQLFFYCKSRFSICYLKKDYQGIDELHGAYFPKLYSEIQVGIQERGMVGHIFSPKQWKAEAGLQVQGQFVLYIHQDPVLKSQHNKTQNQTNKVVIDNP